MRSILVLLVILIGSVKSFSQVQFSVDLSGSYSFIANTEPDPISSIPPNTGYSVQTFNLKYSETFRVKPGFNLSFDVTKQLKDRLSVRFGMGFSFHHYKKETRHIAGFPTATTILDTIYNIPGPAPAPPSSFFFASSYVPNPEPVLIGGSNNGQTKIFYVSIPVMMRYALVPEKLTVGVGVVNYLLAYSSQIRGEYSFDFYNNEYVDRNDKSGDGLNNYLLSGSLLLSYKLFKTWGAQVNYNYSFSQIYDKDSYSSLYVSNRKARYRTIGLGISYTFKGK
ncbi:MAG: outer membrane beta-barrel protein [Cyclobacteriaceae bacterium]|nr:outer membrane beta-barrel protein [Cyclobacteriaceae bacterium]